MRRISRCGYCGGRRRLPDSRQDAGATKALLVRDGKGATFTIYLPKATQAVPAGEEISEAFPAAGGNETVLVVDDQPEVQGLVAAALTARGYHVIKAENAAAALLLGSQERERIDLVVTDMVMPEVNGRELADRLKEHWPGMKVLFMSGYTGDTMLQYGVPEGSMEFLQKPFSPEQLANKVRAVLGREAA